MQDYTIKKPMTNKEKLLFEVTQMIYYSSNPMIIDKLKIVKKRIKTIIT